MPARRTNSRTRTTLLVIMVVVLASAAMAAGFPAALAVLAASGIGTSLLVGDMSNRRSQGAAQQADGAMERFPLAFPAERVRVGGRLHPRFLPSVKAVWAPGVLCIDAGEAEFFPSAERYRDKAWRGRIERAEILKTPWPISFVRLHGSQGTAQFALQYPAKDVRGYLDPYLQLGV